MRLDHPNVEPLCGIAAYLECQSSSSVRRYFEDIGIVSPFQVNGNIRSYIEAQQLESHPNIMHLKLQLLSDVASGLEYLINREIHHGSLRGTNVLISSERRAVLSIPSALWRDNGEYSASVSDHDDTLIRWMAPEEVQFGHEGLGQGTLRGCDIWSFGSLCIEVFTECPPYQELRTKIQVISQLGQRQAPQRPPSLDDPLWELCCSCWQAYSWNRIHPDDLQKKLHELEAKYHRQFPTHYTAWSSNLEGAADLTTEISDVSVSPYIYSDFADVYRGWRSRHDGSEEVALKVPRVNGAKGASFMAVGRPPALVYPLCKFGDVKGFLQLQLSNPSLLGQKLVILEEVFQAVHYLHNHMPPITHGHLKGVRMFLFQHFRERQLAQDNIMVASDGTAYLCDFSLAEMDPGPAADPPPGDDVDEAPKLTSLWQRISSAFVRRSPVGRSPTSETHATVDAPQATERASPISASDALSTVSYTSPTASVVKGSYRWMAPELLDERTRRTPETDIWACGCLILEILSLTIPYKDFSNDAMVIGALLHKQSPSRPKGIPDELWELCERCWAVEASQRPDIATVLEVIGKARTMYPSTKTDTSQFHAISPDAPTFENDRALFVDEDITTKISNVSPHSSAGGAFSDIYQAELATAHGTIKVAIKNIREYTSKQKALALFKREITVWCKLEHPNILRLFGLSWNHDTRNLPGMVSPWCSNGDASSFLCKQTTAGANLQLIKYHMRRSRRLCVVELGVELGQLFGALAFEQLLLFGENLVSSK
ncbi:kinase-like protein, partial [Auricularia subglabra TFB-10046 SS5]